MAASCVPRIIKVKPRNTLFFACDLQTRFRHVIHAFDHVVDTANKMFKVAKVLDIPVVITEQNPKGLGPTVPELKVSTLGHLHIGTYSKTLFSMLTPDITNILATREPPVKSVVLFGIESHVCVLQTALDLLERNYEVHVLSDGVSSCNKEEVPLALERLRQAGAQITTSESVSYQLMVDSANPSFKEFVTIIKDEREATEKTLRALFPLSKEQ